MASIVPPHMSAAYDRGREVNRCRNVGCGLMMVPDKKDKRILRCPPQCHMQRAETIDRTQKEKEEDSRGSERQRQSWDRLKTSMAAE